MDWNEIRYFLAVARHGGLTGASLELNVSPATVSRRIEAFERSMKKILFIKRQTGYLLTSEGEKMLADVMGVEYAMMKFERQTLQPAGSTPFEGLIRIATSELIASYLITPRLPAFFAAYPLMRVELLTSLDQASLPRRAADIALRMMAPSKDEEGEHIAHPAGKMSFAPYVSVAEKNRADWRGMPYVSWDNARSHYPMAEWIASTYMDTLPTLSSNSLNVQLMAARSNIGVSVLPTFIGDNDPLLTRIISDAPVVSRQLWIVYHRDLRGNERISAMRDFLSQVVSNIVA